MDTFHLLTICKEKRNNIYVFGDSLLLIEEVKTYRKEEKRKEKKAQPVNSIPGHFSPVLFLHNLTKC